MTTGWNGSDLTANTVRSTSTTAASIFQQITSPSTPAATTNALYFKSDNNLYMKNSSGVETQISGGGVTAPLTLTGTTDVTQLTVIGNATQTSLLWAYKNSSAANIFYGDAIATAVTGSNGHNAPGHIFFPKYGMSETTAVGDPPLTFEGADRTGLSFHPFTNTPESLYVVLKGQWVMNYYYTLAGAHNISTLVDNFYPDTSVQSNLGRPAAPWAFTYSKGGYTFGDQNGNGEVAALVANGENEGLYFNTSTGTYMKLTLFDVGLTGYHTMKWQAISGGWTQQFTDDVQVNANAGYSVTVGGQNKTAGTGNGGNVILTGGTSAGGVPGSVIVPSSGASSAPSFIFTGTPFAGGSSITTKPLVLLEDTGNTSTGWSTAGTYLGINAKTGFVGNVADFQLNGNSIFTIGAGSGSNLLITDYGGGAFVTIQSQNEQISTILLQSVPGTYASPTPTVSGDQLGSLVFSGQLDTTPGNVSQSAHIEADAAQDFTGSAAGTRLNFIVTANDTNFGYSSWIMDQDGGFKAGTAGTGYLQLAQISAPANPPASTNDLYFKSGDGLFIKNSAGTELQVSTNLPGDSNLSYPVTASTGTGFSTVATIALPSDTTAYLVTAKIVGRKSGGGKHAVFELSGAFNREGAGAAQEGTTVSLVSVNTDDATYAAQFSVSGNNVLVQAHGNSVSAETVNWQVIAEIVSVT